MKDLVIFGTGGFAREVHQIVEDFDQVKSAWNFIGFLDGNPESHNKEIHGFPVLGGAEWLAGRRGVAVVVAIGGPAGKRKVVEQIRAAGETSFATLVHPLAWVGNRVSLGEGVVICAGTLITTDIRLGNHVILNLDCTVGHDSCIEDYVTVAPSVNISGCVKVGEGCDLGTNSTVIQGITIGHWSVVGAGAVVVRNIPSNTTAVGIPAKPIKERPEGWQEQ